METLPCVTSAMHCCFGWKYSPEEIEQRQLSLKIDKAIKKEKQYKRRSVKLLLLGAGESGKSTFLKQMKIIHGLQFHKEDLSEYQAIIYQNIIRGMRVLVDAREKLAIPWENNNNSEYAPILLRIDNAMLFDTRVFLEYVPCIQELWKDAGIREAYDRRREFQLEMSTREQGKQSFPSIRNKHLVEKVHILYLEQANRFICCFVVNEPNIDFLPYFAFFFSCGVQSDSVRYFFDHLDRIAVREYTPTNQDILHARKATKGVTEFVLNINSIPFHFVDVGGQRSQRQKWLQCFDSVTAILFLVSSSEYDQVILEDRRTRRLEESRNIFETIFNLRYLTKAAFILFLNKTDLLKEKLESRTSNIAHYFPEFEGDPFDLDSVQAFMLNMFVSARKDARRSLYHHFTTAVDTENVNKVFGAVKNFILQGNLAHLMLQ